MDLKCASKKGQADIAIIVIIFIVLFAIVSLVIYNAFDKINTELQVDDDLSNNSKAIVDNLHERYPSTMDGAIITALVIFFILLLGLAWVATNNPFAMLIAIIVMIFLLVTSIMLSNIWDDFTDESEYSTLVQDFPKSNWVLDNFLMVSLAMITSMIFVMVSKSRSG